MACCASGKSPEEAKRLRDEKKRSKEVDQALSSNHRQDMQISKLLLLGAGESGKSTLFKQMVQIYGKGWSDEDRLQYRTIITNNVLTSIKTLCEQSEHFKSTEPTEVAEDLLQSKQYILEELKMDGNEPKTLQPDLAAHIDALWKDPGIQRTYELRSKYQLFDGAKHFLDSVEQIARPDYIPSTDDVLHARVRTTGIVEQEFLVDGNTFKMFDVGGQRNERKKWIHCFEDVTAVLFIVAISEYDQSLFEDETVNRMSEALQLWDEISGSQWFRKTSMILFLNKKDLFDLKIQKVPLSRYFPEFAQFQEHPIDHKQEPIVRFEEESYELFNQRVHLEFMKNLFLTVSAQKHKQVYAHPTCATSTDVMRVVFTSVKDIVIRRSLAEGGLLSDN